MVYTFVRIKETLMAFNNKYYQRHKVANQRLAAAFDKMVAKKKYLKTPIYKIVEAIADKAGVSRQTVYNYTASKGKDGFMKECIMDIITEDLIEI